MESLKLENILNDKYNKKHDIFIEYGTAGFRTAGHILGHVVYRMGILAALRSKVKKATIGLMITASHNAEPDNGVKLIDPAGEMMERAWEEIATNLANVNNSNLISTIQNIIKEQNIDMSINAFVAIGRDTRKSSPMLMNAAIAGIQILNAGVQDFGVVTTPQLHYLVVCMNTNGYYGEPTVNGYYEKLSNAFKQIRQDKINNGKYVAEIKVDAANGVGAIAAKEFQDRLKTILIIDIYNDGDGELNYMCGADYVKGHQKPPANFRVKPNVRCVTVDGDADRVLYFYFDENNQFHLLDGDRIATLFAVYLKELLQECQLSFHLGLVQTAYANGGSTDYISNVLKIPVVCAPTGIKFVQDKASEFDIGIYFEANGHGSVVFRASIVEAIKNVAVNTQLEPTKKAAASKLLNVLNLINQTVGDAFSDMLLVETILHAKGWSIVEWEKLYRDLPNRLMPLTVKDKNVITTTDAGRRCVTPKGMQHQIDQIVSQYKKARCFVRPSGTEDIVRIYAECENIYDLEKLIIEVATLVYKEAGGVGPEPRR